MTVLEVQEPNEIVYEMAGGFPGKWIYNLEQQANGTAVRTKVQYFVCGGIIGKVADWLFY